MNLRSVFSNGLHRLHRVTVTCDDFSVEVAVRRYIGYSTVTLVTVVGKSFYVQLRRVTRSDMWLPTVTRFFVCFFL